MFHCVLYQPEIPPNTGSIIRLCANTDIPLHLIHPLGFELEDRKLKRAGLDYHEWARVHNYDSINEFIETVKPQRIFACSTRGKTCYTSPNYQTEDTFIFGPESSGLPQTILDKLPKEQVIRIPMHTDKRSINLSNAVSIILYEAWRQMDFQ
ncbi:MAG: tRNA (uridine(34)/cytosine(34)/5-carboxymethylaminomethyluridine(34)-2'-O)-methyltransferase TrmL [Thiotrichaceae bacterium]|nr:tRNA (uridine(34)/cytosine(34)/5-carboxymethylaminomethyluridine(34)-2'-O)-methyltransferase TrmL [Thiotrichaceae bacterium]